MVEFVALPGFYGGGRSTGLTCHFLKATGKIHQSLYDEIAVLPDFV
jgi:hypothetical protein